MPRSLTTQCFLTLSGLAWLLGIPAAHADPVISNIELGPTLVTLTFSDNGHVWAGVLSSGLVDRNFGLERIRAESGALP